MTKLQIQYTEYSVQVHTGVLIHIMMTLVRLRWWLFFTVNI